MLILMTFMSDNITTYKNQDLKSRLESQSKNSELLANVWRLHWKLRYETGLTEVLKRSKNYYIRILNNYLGDLNFIPWNSYLTFILLA